MVSYLFIFYLLIIVNERNLAQDIDIYSTNVTLEWGHFSIFNCENNSIDISLFECICSTEYQGDSENRCVKEQTDTYDSEACFATTTSTTSSSTSSTTTTSTTSSSTSSTTTTSTTSSSTSSTTKTSTTSSSTSPTTTTSTPISRTSPTTTNKPIVTEPPPYQCKDPNYIGDHCNIPIEICKISNPCSPPYGTCHPDKTLESGYTCQCSDGHSGDYCESDNRICKNNTCWHDGKCIIINETILFDNETTFDCLCEPGYDGENCELMIDMCTNITCQNKGNCISSYPTWRCQCILEAYYYGEYCEKKHASLIVRQALSKSFASIAITAIVTLFLFVITMDILKYAFKIDPVDRERRLMKLEQEKNQYKKKKKKKEPKKIALRFLYVP